MCSRNCPSNPLRPHTNNSAVPATAVGIAVGRLMMIMSAALPLNSYLLITQAAVNPNTTLHKVATLLVVKLSLREKTAAGDTSASQKWSRPLPKPKIKIEVIMESDLVSEAVKVIQEKARTGQIGDGKIFILPVEEVVRIRTGETGNEAI